MCGIIGYVGNRASKDLLIRGLERLEFRGYDSAGIALLEVGGLEYVRCRRQPRQSQAQVAGPNGSCTLHNPASATTRWATEHGGVNEDNAHPLTGLRETGKLRRSCSTGSSRTTASLKKEARGHRPSPFSSETRRRGRGAPARDRLRTATSWKRCAPSTPGSRATSPSSRSIHDEPELALVGVRYETPMVVEARRRRELPRLEPVCFPGRNAPGDVSGPGRHRRGHSGRRPVSCAPPMGPLASSLEEIRIDWDEEVAERTGFETFMLEAKIYEQPYCSVEVTIGDRGPARPSRPGRSSSLQRAGAAMPTCVGS